MGSCIDLVWEFINSSLNGSNEGEKGCYGKLGAALVPIARLLLKNRELCENAASETLAFINNIATKGGNIVAEWGPLVVQAAVVMASLYAAREAIDWYTDLRKQGQEYQSRLGSLWDGEIQPTLMSINEMLRNMENNDPEDFCEEAKTNVQRLTRLKYNLSEIRGLIRSSEAKALSSSIKGGLAGTTAAVGLGGMAYTAGGVALAATAWPLAMGACAVWAVGGTVAAAAFGKKSYDLNASGNDADSYYREITRYCTELELNMDLIRTRGQN